MSVSEHSTYSVVYRLNSKKHDNENGFNTFIT